MRFPELSSFASAVCRWAQAGSWLVVLMVDHGSKTAAYRLSERFMVVFAGPAADADDIIVESIDWWLSCCNRVHVVSSDQLLRQRCGHHLPDRAQQLRCELGAPRSSDERNRLTLDASAPFGRLLSLPGPTSSPCDCCDVLQPPAPAREATPEGSLSRRSRRKAAARLEQSAAEALNERTADRTRHADVLLRRLEASPQVAR